ncbi:EscU/YscU/HrcU family type III secretion system export apparatus switch protein [Microcella flavibacter]|uniref:EscU/YscU/HrcU family type III secretion system export apparatus switch protein n=1 Tax=Microcella flavibacter TaxID=1804990 RepID=UPI001456A24B|nr:EscU/YscU/HrcU family type III secretion system export apparatus switch protein [Microcella flavibacter]
MTESDAPYPPKPVLVASEKPVAPSVRPAVWLAAVALVAIVTGGYVASAAAGIGAIVFALAARRELRSNSSLAGTLRSLLAMIVGIIAVGLGLVSVAIPWAFVGFAFLNV